MGDEEALGFVQRPISANFRDFSRTHTPLIQLFADVAPDMLALEYSTPRAGELAAFLADPRIHDSGIRLGLGIMNPRLDEAETVESMVARGIEAADIIGPDRVALNPDCGFATFSNRPVNTYEGIEAKVSNMVEAARQLRERYA